MLKIENIKKRYSNGRVDALNGISLSFPEKGFVAILGESGSGKSTLVNILSGTDTPTSGKITYSCGDETLEYGKRHHMTLLRRNVLSYVFQETVFIDSIDVEENILLSSMVQGIADTGLLEEKKGKLLKQTKLQDKTKQKLYEISGGQKQRATLVRGLLKESKILIADEPTSAQDDENELALFNILKEESLSKLVILVTHSKLLARRYCDRLIELKDGVCIHDDIIEHESADDSLIIDDNKVIVSNIDDLNLDFETIKQLLIRKDEIILSIRHKNYVEKQSGNDLSHDIAYNSQVSNKNHRFFSFFLFRHIFAQKVTKTILITLVLGFILSVFSFLTAMTDTSDSDVIYDVLRINNQESVVLELSQKVGYSSAKEELDYLRLKKEHLQLFFDGNLFIDALPQPEKPYETNIINGIATCDSKDVSIIIGSFPQDGSAMISDYLADQLISKTEKYSSYDDILKLGITVSGFPIHISAVYDTDYESYFSYLELNSLSSEEYILRSTFYYKNDHIYSRLVLSAEALRTNMNKKSIDFCILNETYPSRVCVDPIYSTSSESTLVINEKFFSYYGDVPFYQYNSEEAEAYSIHVVEDGNDYPTIYLSEEYFDDFVNTYFMTSGYLLGLDCGKESFKEYQSIYPIFSAINTQLNEYLNFTWTLSQLSFAIRFVLSIAAVSLACCIPGIYSGSIRSAIGIIRAFGASNSDIIKFEGLFFVAEYLLASISYLIMFFTVSAFGGGLLSEIFKMNMNGLILPNISNVFYVLGVSLLLGLVATAILVIIRTRTCITELLK